MTERTTAVTVRAMRRVRASVFVFPFVVLVGTAVFAQPDGAGREAGVRGHVVVAAELQAATEVVVDDARALSMRTPAHVRRARGRKIQPLMEPLPELLIVVEGEDVRADNVPPKTVTIKGMRFVPGQVLMTRPGALAVANEQGQTLTIESDGKALETIAAGETRQITLPAGVHSLTMRELPYARATVKVLERGRALPLDGNGDVAFVGFVEGDYQLSFWLGVGELHRRDFRIARNGLSYIDATVSANTVVDVSIKDVGDPVAVPVTRQPPPRPPPPPPPEEPLTP